MFAVCPCWLGPHLRGCLETPEWVLNFSKSMESKEKFVSPGTFDVDARDPSAAQPRPFALWQRFERRGVADPRIFAAAARQDRPSLGLADARNVERHLLRAAERLSLAVAARTLPAASDDLSLVRPLSRRRLVGELEPSPGNAGSRARRPRGQPFGGRDRQPIGENHGKRGSARLRRRQKDQRPQASRVGRYRRSGAD